MCISAPFIITLSLTALATTLSPASSFPQSAPPLNRFGFDTKVAVDGRSTVQVYPPLHAISNNVTLTDYMRLPVEQYVLIPMPLGSSLTRVGRNNINFRQTDGTGERTSTFEELFKLEVPTITFFSLSLQPVVYAKVQPQSNSVVISSNKCILHGSPFIEKVKLNDRFIFDVRCTLTWRDSLCNERTSGYASEQYLNEADVSPTMSDPCTISAETIIDVDVNVPRPFSSIPKPILQRTGNAAMKLSMKYIQRNFVENLAKDYEKWASDIEYRRFRASLSDEEVVPLLV